MELLVWKFGIENGLNGISDWREEMKTLCWRTRHINGGMSMDRSRSKHRGKHRSLKMIPLEFPSASYSSCSSCLSSYFCDITYLIYHFSIIATQEGIPFFRIALTDRVLTARVEYATYRESPPNFIHCVNRSLQERENPLLTFLWAACLRVDGILMGCNKMLIRIRI